MYSTIETERSIDIEHFDTPYRYFVFKNLFGEEKTSVITRQLLAIPRWKYVPGITNDMWRHRLVAGATDELSVLLFTEVAPIRKLLEREYRIQLSTSRFDLVAHKLTRGQRIPVHNDAPGLGDATHHIVINFTPQYPEDAGGYSFICAERSAESVQAALQPVADTGFSFEASTKSFHGVGRVSQERRFTVMYSFWHVGNSPAVQNRITSGLTEALDAYACEINTEEKELLYKLAASEIAKRFPGALTRWVQTYSLLRQWGIAQAEARLGLVVAVWNDFATNGAGQAALQQMLEEVLGENSFSLPGHYERFQRVNGPSVSPEAEQSPLRETYFAMAVVQSPHRYFRDDQWQRERAQYGQHRDFLRRESLPLLDEVYQVAP